MATLARVREILGDACVELAKLDEIRHPDARWLLADLTEAIGEQLISAQAEQDRIRNSPVVVESSYDPDLALQDLLERRRLDRAP